MKLTTNVSEHNIKGISAMRSTGEGLVIALHDGKLEFRNLYNDTPYYVATYGEGATLLKELRFLLDNIMPDSIDDEQYKVHALSNLFKYGTFFPIDNEYNLARYIYSSFADIESIMLNGELG